MKRCAFTVLALVALLGVPWCVPGRTGGEQQAASKPVRIAVVASTQTPVHSLSVDELRRIFLRQTTRWPNGWAITVFERSGDSPIREQFSRTVMRQDPSALRQYWLTLQVTQGMKGPTPCSSTALLKEYLGRVKGGIGYMYLHEADKTVKIVKILEIRD